MSVIEPLFAAVIVVGFLAYVVRKVRFLWSIDLSGPTTGQLIAKIERDLAELEPKLKAIEAHQAAIARVDWAFSRIGRFKDVQPPVRNP